MKLSWMSKSGQQVPATVSLQSALKSAAGFRVRRRRVFLICMGALPILTLFIMFSNSLPSFVFIGVLGFISIAAVVSAILLVFVKLEKSKIEALLHSDDPAVIGGLIDLNEMYEPKAVPLAKDALIRLLPQLTAMQAMSISKRHRNSLRRFILPFPFRVTVQSGATQYKHGTADRELTFAVLEAMPNIANADDLHFLSQIADGKTRLVPDAEALEKITEILPLVQARIKSPEPAEGLLRASSAPENLLRPASAIVDSDSELLLRPVAKEE
ncbi:MAG: hypothetical protein ABJA67_06860 [Chthonomonadales bacterium]